MIPKLKKSQKQVNDFWIINRKLCIQDAHDQLHIPGIQVPKSISEGFFLIGKWWLQNQSLFLLEQGTLRLVAPNKTVHSIDKKNNTLLLAYDFQIVGDAIESKLSLFDLQTLSDIQHPLLSVNYKEYPFRHQTTLITVSQSRFLKAMNLLTGTPLWEADLRQIGAERASLTDGSLHFSEYIGVAGRILWLSIQSGILLGVNLDTGQFKHILQDVVRMTAGHDDYPHWRLPLYGTGQTIYDRKTHRLIGMQDWHYWEVDLRAPKLELKMWLLMDDFKQHQMNSQNPERRCMNDHYIYFASAEWARIAALNRKTLKLDWVFHSAKELPEMGIPMQIVVNGHHLYVKDHQKVLYTFELDKDHH